MMKPTDLFLAVVGFPRWEASGGEDFELPEGSEMIRIVGVDPGDPVGEHRGNELQVEYDLPFDGVTSSQFNDLGHRGLNRIHDLHGRGDVSPDFLDGFLGGDWIRDPTGIRDHGVELQQDLSG